MTGVEIIAAILIAVGLVGIIVPVLPGDWLVLIAVLVWAAETGGGTAWAFALVAVGLLVTGAVFKYAVPGKRLKQHGIATSALVFAAVLGVVGFFVIPVVGLPIGFVAGVYVSQWHARGRAEAWPATVAALRAVGLAIAIEFTFALAATATWVVGVIVT